VSYNFYGAITETGGSTGAADAIDGATLSDIDGMIMIKTSQNARFYTLEESSGASESSPTILSPNSSAGNKRWLMCSVDAIDFILRESGTSNTTTLSLSSGDMTITNNVDDKTISLIGSVGAASKTMLVADPAGSVDLYFANSKKFETLTGGARVTGDLEATTSLTVGGTVLTDATITDDAALSIIADSITIKHGTAASDAVLSIGQDDTQRGLLNIYGDATSNVDGGGVYLYVAADYDTTINNYSLLINEDDLLIGPSTDTDALKYNGGNNKWVLSASGGTDITAGDLTVTNGISAGDLTVTNGISATTIDTTSANEWSKPQSVDEKALTSSSNSVAWDASAAQTAVHTLTENTTIANPTNLKAGATYILRVVQAAGAYTLAWGTNYKWGTASAPSEPAANGDVIIVSFYSDGTNMYGVEAVREEA